MSLFSVTINPLAQPGNSFALLKLIFHKPNRKEMLLPCNLCNKNYSYKKRDAPKLGAPLVGTDKECNGSPAIRLFHMPTARSMAPTAPWSGSQY